MCIHTCIHTYVHTCTHIYIYICVHARVYIYIYIYMYMDNCACLCPFCMYQQSLYVFKRRTGTSSARWWTPAASGSPRAVAAARCWRPSARPSRSATRCLGTNRPHKHKDPTFWLVQRPSVRRIPEIMVCRILAFRWSVGLLGAGEGGLRPGWPGQWLC